MILFFLKKAFFDGWDHLFLLVALNIGFLALGGGMILVPPLLAPLGLFALYAVLVFFILLFSVYFATVVFFIDKVADFGNPGPKDFSPALKAGLAPGLQVGAALAGGWFLLSVGLPFYFSRGGLVGAFAAGLLLWCALVAVLALQYYLPLRARLGGGIKKNARKCMVLFFDNPGFSIFLFFYNAGTLVLSVFFAFLAPGFAGTALVLDDALKLRLHKYDWLEKNPKANRKQVPWGELLEEDKELVGKRTLKGMIFPWKE